MSPGRAAALAFVFILSSLARPGGAQVYRPPIPYALWDSLLVPDDGRYELFFAQSEPGKLWNTVGRAVSTDLAHWTGLPSLSLLKPQGAWDGEYAGANYLVRHEGRWVMTINTGPPTRPWLAFSTDLTHWEKYPGNPVLGIEGPYYGGEDWRDLQIVWSPPERRWHGYITAHTPILGDQPGMACIGHLTSPDLIHWEYLPPLLADGRFRHMEVPHYFQMGQWHYLLFSNGWSSVETPSHAAGKGTFYALSEHRDGPYRLPEDPLLLGSGHDRWDNYVGRTIPYQGGQLLYHHTAVTPINGASPDCLWGVPKLVRQNPDGTLWLQYWPGLAGLESRVLVEPEAALPPGEVTGAGAWSANSGTVTGRASTGPSVLWLPAAAADVMLTAEIHAGTAEKVGLVWRWDGSRGAGLLLEPGTGRAEIVDVAAAGEGLTAATVDDFRGALGGRGPWEVRVLVRAHRVEIYLDDRWLFGTTMLQSPPDGKLGLWVERGTARFASVRVAQVEPLR